MGAKRYTVLPGSDSPVLESVFKNFANRYGTGAIDEFLQAQVSPSLAQQSTTVPGMQASMSTACQSIASNGFQYAAGRIDQTQFISSIGQRTALAPGSSEGVQQCSLTLDGYFARGIPNKNSVTTVRINNLESFVKSSSIHNQGSVASVAYNAAEVNQSAFLAQMALSGCTAEHTAEYDDLACAQNIAPVAFNQANALGLYVDHSPIQPLFPLDGTVAAANTQNSATLTATSFAAPDSQSPVVYSPFTGYSRSHPAQATMIDTPTGHRFGTSNASELPLVSDEEDEPFDGLKALEAIALFERQYASSSITVGIPFRLGEHSSLQGWNEVADQVKSMAVTDGRLPSTPSGSRKKTVSRKKGRITQEGALSQGISLAQEISLSQVTVSLCREC